MKETPDLKSLRLARKLTLAEVAQRMDVSKGFVCHLENGIRRLNDDLTKRMATVLDCPENEVWKAGQRSGENNTIANSWISQVRINGYPVFDAFKYYLQAEKKKPDVRSRASLRKQLAQFISENLPFSVMAELSENDILLDQVVEHCRD
jgi:transcriptional regulator with XRE-family HTH domain